MAPSARSSTAVRTAGRSNQEIYETFLEGVNGKADRNWIEIEHTAARDL